MSPKKAAEGQASDPFSESETFEDFKNAARSSSSSASSSRNNGNIKRTAERLPDDAIQFSTRRSRSTTSMTRPFLPFIRTALVRSRSRPARPRPRRRPRSRGRPQRRPAPRGGRLRRRGSGLPARRRRGHDSPVVRESSRRPPPRGHVARLRGAPGGRRGRRGRAGAEIDRADAYGADVPAVRDAHRSLRRGWTGRARPPNCGPARRALLATNPPRRADARRGAVAHARRDRAAADSANLRREATLAREADAAPSGPRPRGWRATASGRCANSTGPGSRAVPSCARRRAAPHRAESLEGAARSDEAALRASSRSRRRRVCSPPWPAC